MTDQVRVTTAAGVCEIMFARPDKKNAVSNAMYRATSAAITAAQQDDAIRVVLLSAEGADFCAGNDIAEFAAHADGTGEAPQGQLLIQALATAIKPIVAAVPGRAVGIGTTMLLHCDLVHVADSTMLSAPFVPLGLVPEAGSSLLLPARIGHVRAFGMFALGDEVTGPEAVTLGLANRCLPVGDLLEATRATALALARQPLGSLIGTKALMRDPQGLTAHIDRESALFRARLASDEARAAFARFFGRRSPEA